MTERLLSEYVPWTDYFDQNIIGMRDHSLFMMVEMDGQPFETMDDVIINARHNTYESALRDFAQPGLTYHFLQCRGTADISLYPEGRFHTEFAERLDRRYRASLFDGSMWLNKTYLAVQLSPWQIGGKKLSKLFSRSTKAEGPTERMRRLRRIVGTLCETLRGFHPRVLGITQRGWTLYSEIAEAMAFAMTGYWRPVPFTIDPVPWVFSESFIMGTETFEVRMPHRSAWGAVLAIDDFPAITRPGMFDRFLSASYRHTVFHAYRCLPAIDGAGLCTRKQNTMRTAGDLALSQASELTDAADMVMSNRLGIGDYAGATVVFTDDLDSLTSAVQEAWGDMSGGGARIERESLTNEAVLFSLVPGNFLLRARQAAISSRNFAAAASLHNFPTGQRRGFWGPPLAMLRTSGGTPYYLHLHTNGVGNTLITGATGTGKTTLIGVIICQAERFGAQVVLWDKDHGLEALVRTLGGAYLALANRPDQGSGLSPLKRLTDSPDDITFLAGLLRACGATPEPYNFTPEEDRRLGLALRHVMAGPPEDRSLMEIRKFLGTSRDGAGARLEKWCWGNELGWIIDCPNDIVDLDNRLIAFDQSALIEDKVAAGAVLATLFHYTGKLVDGRKLLFILDEVWKALEIPQFHAQIHNGLKTWRKYNSPIIMGTQDVADALKSPIGQTIRGQTPNQIYFSAPGAAWQDHGPDGMRLTETEFDIIQKLPMGSGFFLLKQGDQSVVAQASLRDMPEEIAVISGTRNGIDALNLARERTDDASGLALAEAYREALLELAVQ